METQNSFTKNLDALMEQLDISNSALAKGIGVDASLVSKWRKGSRAVKSDSPYAEGIADYIVGRRGLDEREASWLRVSILANYPDTSFSTVDDYRRAICRWLNADRKQSIFAAEKKFLSAGIVDSFSAAMAGTTASFIGDPISGVKSDALVVTGAGNIASLVGLELSKTPEDSNIFMFLSSESLTTAVNESFTTALLAGIKEKRLHLKMLLQSGNDSEANSNLVAAFMPLFVLGEMDFLVIPGTPQTFTAELTLFLHSGCSISIREILGENAQPTALVCRDAGANWALASAFERSARYAKPMMRVYNDSYSKSIVEVFFDEYGTAGDLDVIKDGLNPMFMSVDVYERLLESFGYGQVDREWRLEVFGKLKEAMNKVLETSVFREAVSVPRLEEIIKTGVCRMPAAYYSDSGVMPVSAELCADILEGYVDYLENVPNFRVQLFDDPLLFHPNSCWHIKKGRHTVLHSWDVDSPAMVYSDQYVMINEFQKHFDYIWGADRGEEGRREAIDGLKGLVRRMKKCGGGVKPVEDKKALYDLLRGPAATT